ncbi:MAG TPA: hypothetical protein VFJ70_02615 [Burkholderiales bacterium]|nr:hypothetical protein [Burkholderiales bacterium]
MRHVFAQLLLLGLCFAARAQADALPRYFGAAISPGGNYLAVAAKGSNSRYTVNVFNLVRRNGRKPIADFGGDVTRVLWQSEDRMVVYVGDLSSGEPRERGIVAIDADGRDAVTLGRYGVPDFVHTTNSDDILLGVAGYAGRPGHDVYRVNTRTLKETLLTSESPGKVTSWVVDLAGVPRAAVVADRESDRSAWYVRKSAAAPWQVVEEARLDSLPSKPMAFDSDGKTLYVLSRRNGDHSALYAFDVTSASWDGPILRHPKRDIAAAFYSDFARRQFLGVSYQDDKPSFLWFDPERMKIQKSVDAALPGRSNQIDKGGDWWLVVSSSDREPGEVYLLDGKSMSMQKLLSYR